MAVPAVTVVTCERTVWHHRCAATRGSGVFLLLDLLHHARQYVARTGFGELRHAATDEEADALTPLHRVVDLVDEQRPGRIRAVPVRIRLGGGIGDDRDSRR